MDRDRKATQLIYDTELSMFCQCCGTALERNFKFCPQCGKTISRNDDKVSSTRSTSSNPSTRCSSTSQTRGGTGSSSSLLPSSKLPKFAVFKSAKEKERSSFFVRKGTSKRSKVAVPSKKEVKITIAVMEDAKKIKRGDSLPLKVPESSTPHEIPQKAIEKHVTFNKRFNAKIDYLLVFKDGTKVKTIPGTEPPEPFTLRIYKEVSGYGYSQIRFCLVPLIQKCLSDLKAVIAESDSESVGEDDYYDDDEDGDDDVLQKSPFETATLTSAAESLNPNTSPQDDQPGPSTSLPQLGPSISTPFIHSNLLQDDQPGSSFSTVPKVQCPLCFDAYPINKVESHADECSGAFGLVEENSLDRPIEHTSSAAASTMVDNEKPNDTSLAMCINELKDRGLKSDIEMVRITVRRKMLWQDFKRARNRYYQPDRLLKITFAGEPAVDDGGPKREFFSGKICIHVFATFWN